MIDVSTNRGANAARFLNMISQHLAHFRAQRFGSEKWTAIFCGEDEMDPSLSERLRHLRSIRFVGQMAGPLARSLNCIANYPGRWPGLGKLLGLWPAATDWTCGL